MSLKKLSKEWKGEVIDVVLALGAAVIAYLAFNYFNPGVEDMLSAVVFILVLILLKQK